MEKRRCCKKINNGRKMLLEGNSFYVPAQSLSFLNVAYNFTDSGGKTPYSRVLHCEGENNKDVPGMEIRTDFK